MEGKQVEHEPRPRDLGRGLPRPLRPRPAALLPHRRRARDAGHRLHVGRVRPPQQRRAARELGQPRQPHARRTRTATSAPSPSRATLTEADQRAARRGRARRSTTVGAHIESARFRAALAEAMRASALGEPVRRRPGAVGAREDRPRARRDRALRRAARRRQPEDDLHAVPALQLAGAARAARLRGLARRAARVPHASTRRTARRTRCSPATTRAGSAAGSRASCRRARRCASRGRSSASSTPDDDDELGELELPRDRHARAPRPRSTTPDEVDRARAPRPASRGSSPSARASTTAARALELAERARRRLRGPRHPPARGGHARRRTTSPSCASCSRTRRRSRSARPASTGSATTRRATTQRRLFAAELELAAELGKPVVIHTRAADDDTLAALADHAGRSSSTASRRRTCSRPRSSAAGTSRSPAT